MIIKEITVEVSLCKDYNSVKHSCTVEVEDDKECVNEVCSALRETLLNECKAGIKEIAVESGDRASDKMIAFAKRLGMKNASEATKNEVWSYIRAHKK